VVKKTTTLETRAETAVHQPPSSPAPVPAPAPPPALPAPADGLLPDLDSIGLAGEDPTTPLPPSTPPAPPASVPAASAPGAAFPGSDVLLPDLDSVQLAGDELTAHLAPASTPRQPAAPPDEELATVEAVQEDLVEVEAAPPGVKPPGATSSGDDDLVDVEAVGAPEDLVEVEAADSLDDVQDVDEIEQLDDVDDVDDLDISLPDPLPGMLGYDEFLIRPKAGFGNLNYDIVDYDTKDLLGMAKEERGLLGMLAGRKAAKLAVYDDLRDRLLCTLYRPFSLVKSRVEIRDHKERMLGTVAFRFLQVLGATIYDWDEREWATIKGKWGAVPAMHIKDMKGRKLGKFTFEGYKTKKVVFKIFTKGMSWYVKVYKPLRYDAEGKLLMLASAIAYDMVRISMDGSGVTVGT
jgi:hypothetical protein